MEDIMGEASSSNDEGSMKYKDIDFSDLTTDGIKALEFGTVKQAEDFFYAYGRVVGFGVRKNRIGHKNGKVVMRSWTCAAEGRRRPKKKKKCGVEKCADPPVPPVRRQKKETRFNCRCMFKVRYMEQENVYEVEQFVGEHTHKLVPDNQSHLIPSHRFVPDSQFALVSSLRKVSIRTCHAFQHMADTVGGFSNVGFTMKDLYNKLDSNRREILADGDSEATILYLKNRVALDSGLFSRYTVDDDNRLATLFWRDSQALADYTCFGDVLLFDSTYRTNAYGKPLLLFVGVNNHLSSTIFGFALLNDETFETYKWVLETFLESMNGKRPVAVLTDGDLAMRNAIEAVIPGCPHRLCTWHIAKNAKSHLSREAFSEFCHCMWYETSVRGLEQRWGDMVRKFRLQKNSWIDKMYDTKDKWAQAYASGLFLARMRSTQRCEGMNSYVKDFFKTGIKMFELIMSLDRALAGLRNKVLENDFFSGYGEHVITSPLALEPLEKHASNIYTDNVFTVVQREIQQSGGLITKKIVEYDYSNEYTVTVKKNDEEHRFKTNFYKEAIPRITCSCKLFAREGIPCCHSFHVMKHEGLSEIPLNLILKRWTKDVKPSVAAKLPVKDMSTEAIHNARLGDLSRLSSRISYLASKTNEGTEMFKVELEKLEPIVGNLLKQSCDNSGSPAVNCGNIVQDPIPVRSKGMKEPGPTTKGRRRYRCSACGNFGHRRDKCLVRKNRKRRSNEGRGVTQTEGGKRRRSKKDGDSESEGDTYNESEGDEGDTDNEIEGDEGDTDNEIEGDEGDTEIESEERDDTVNESEEGDSDNVPVRRQLRFPKS